MANEYCLKEFPASARLLRGSVWERSCLFRGLNGLVSSRILLVPESKAVGAQIPRDIHKWLLKELCYVLPNEFPQVLLKVPVIFSWLRALDGQHMMYLHIASYFSRVLVKSRFLMILFYMLKLLKWFYKLPSFTTKRFFYFLFSHNINYQG